MIVEFTSAHTEAPVAVSALHVVQIVRSGSGTSIKMGENRSIQVTDSYGDVVAAIAQALAPAPFDYTSLLAMVQALKAPQ
ncbi:hypothetical protein HOU03_gp083 [Caulobacter phage CcrSC]|uniref:Uncharacterized protein n=1 Tax=Caulobacter phage CcrSC TaxID=2283272 RepID=A0A385EF66_9CAUD|nr:hypothetical protein HOU03_gp083 [Caulobacter phage CcrSC]AXQ69665.1 hypothetical protein CcrSC_gp083 [Caulobacter phage CcrSC]